MTDPTEIIDAHVHLWDLRRRDQAWIGADSPLRRCFDAADLRAAVGSTPVSSAVLVQVINDDGETDDFIAAGRSEQLIAGVVAWADITGLAFPDRLAQLAGTGQLVGIRHQLQAERDPAGWLGQPAVGRGLAELDRSGSVFDLMIRPAQFDAALQVVRGHPSLRFVVDHIGKPSIAERVLEPWAGGLRRLAAEPNVACKLSGLVTVADLDSWTVADIRPYTDIVLEAFGPARLMFGSDWPVSTLAASYAQVLDVASAVCSELSAPERGQVMASTARTWYRLI